MQPQITQHVKRFSLGVAVIGISALALGTPGAAGANLVMNGNFMDFTSDAPGGGGAQVVNSAVNLSDGYAAIADWTSAPSPAGSVYDYTFLYTGRADTDPSWSPAFGATALWGPANGANNGLSVPPSGDNYIAMDGSNALGLATNFSQNVSGLMVGQQYALTFEWAAAQFNGQPGATNEKWAVTFGSDSQSTPVVGIPYQGFSGWMSATMYFTASSTMETLTFLSEGNTVGNPGGVPPAALLTDVALNATPEPSTIVMLGIGLTAVGFARRLRRPPTA